MNTPANTTAIPRANPAALDAPDLEDGEVRIETPPLRPGGRVEVKLRYAGRSRPLPVDDPDAEGETG